MYKDKLDSFYSEILKDEIYGACYFKIIESKGYYQKNNISTHNRIFINKVENTQLKYSEILEFVHDNEENINGLSFSSSLYTYTANNYISGFNKPFFFSLDKSKLNEIEDNYSYSDEDLGQFQSSNFVVNEKVIKSDLLSSANNTSLLFKSIDYKKINILNGNYDSSPSSILISKGLYDRLFSKSKYQNKKLYVLSLNEIKKKGDKYENIFSSGELSITGIVDDSSLSIYQSCLFPLIYAYSQTCIKHEDLYLTNAIININLINHTTDYYIDLINKYDGEYVGTFPMLEINKEVNNTINRFSIMFFSFSIISLIASCLLVTMSMYLIIKKNKKQIGIYLTLGYTKKEIKKIYFLLITTILFFSYVSSIFLNLLVERILSTTLTNIFSVYIFSLLPYGIPFLLALFQILLVIIFIFIKINKITILDSLKKDSD